MPTTLPDPVAVKSFLGAFRNDAHGEITLRLAQVALVIDTGEFAAELRLSPEPGINPGDDVAVSPPLTGLRVTLEDHTRQPVVIAHDTVSPDAYPRMAEAR